MTLRKHIPRSYAKELGKIRVRKQNRNPNTSPRWKAVAIDAEADNGDIFLICVSDGKRLEYPHITFENVVKFLLRYEGYWVFLYNLQYDADCILKLLPKEILKQYRVKKELKFEYKGYKIHY
ncbi:MAG: DNA polymerase, partial [Nitrososphaerales archaeon]